MGLAETNVTKEKNPKMDLQVQKMLHEETAKAGHRQDTKEP